MGRSGPGRRGGVVAVIPARGGSKGIPHKNIAPLGGRPLISYSIEAAFACGLVDRVIVSTDDARIARAARLWGAEAPFLRPASLATATSSVGPTVAHVLRWLQRHDRRPVRAWMILYPTAPFRTRRLVRACLEPILRGPFVYATTALRRRLGPESVVRVEADGRLRPVLDRPRTAFQPTGSITCERRGRRDEGERFVPLEDPVLQVDIDTPADLAGAERILAEGRWSVGALHEG